MIAFNMARRTRDFGVRIALGAASHQIGAVLQSRLLGVVPADPATYAGVFGLLAAAALVACYLPARRAARVSPMDALRQE